MLIYVLCVQNSQSLLPMLLTFRSFVCRLIPELSYHREWVWEFIFCVCIWWPTRPWFFYLSRFGPTKMHHYFSRWFSYAHSLRIQYTALRILWQLHLPQRRWRWQWQQQYFYMKRLKFVNGNYNAHCSYSKSASEYKIDLYRSGTILSFPRCVFSWNIANICFHNIFHRRINECVRVFFGNENVARRPLQYKTWVE